MSTSLTRRRYMQLWLQVLPTCAHSPHRGKGLLHSTGRICHQKIYSVSAISVWQRQSTEPAFVAVMRTPPEHLALMVGMPVQLRRNVYQHDGRLLVPTGFRGRVSEIAKDDMGEYICLHEHQTIRIRRMLFEYYYWKSGALCGSAECLFCMLHASQRPVLWNLRIRYSNCP